MNDLDLFALGCGVSFIAFAGAYAYLRERFLEGTRRPAREETPMVSAELAPARRPTPPRP